MAPISCRLWAIGLIEMMFGRCPKDFFYMPGTFTNHKSLGYAFVNLVDVKTMKDCVHLTM